MKRAVSFTAILLNIMVFSCGTDYVAEGTKAFNNGNYSDAINFFSQAFKEDSSNHTYDEMISLSYFYRGEELYKTTRNVKVLSANFTEGQKFIPVNPSANFNKQYTKMYLTLATTYASVRAKTDEEKDYYFDQALTAVKEAIALDSNSTVAESLLVSLKEGHFQGLIDKGKDFYNKARRTKNYDLFFTAEYYLIEAKKFENDNPQINNLLQQITKQTLPVLNYRKDISMAVAGVTRERKALIMNLSIKNYSDKPVNLHLKSFTLVDTQGKNYSVNEHEMKKRELFGETCIADTILNSARRLVTGLIAFDAPQEIEIDYVNYQVSPQKFVRKYFR